MKTIHLFALALGVAGTLIASPPTRGATERDQRINDKIFDLLMNDRSLAYGSQKMIATTRDGVVTLTGDVRSQADKEKLHKAIAGAPGVQEVKDSQVFLKPVAAGHFRTERPLGPKSSND